MPDFLVVGAPRAGTTSLARDLSLFPSVFLPRQKELGFFDVQWDRGLDWYSGQFRTAPDDAKVGEATPTYLSAPDALGRIAATVPEVRLIAILRDPVERWWSHYWYNREARRAEGRPPVEVLQAGATEYLEPGFYGRHLTRCLDLFEREQVHVVLLPDLRADARAVYEGLADHLGLGDPVPDGTGQALNESYRIRIPWLRSRMLRHRLWARLPGELGFRLDEWNRVPFTRPTMPAAVRDRLRERYAEDTVVLGDLLARDIPWAAPA